MAKRVYVKRKKRKFTAIISVFAAVFALAIILEAGVFIEHLSSVWSPDYEKRDISSLLLKEERTQQEYDELFRQTGLSRTAIDELLGAGDAEGILEIQSDFFEKRERITAQFAPFTCAHTIDENIKTVPLKDGDIIISPTTHFSYFRLGHAALVTDAENGDIAASVGYASLSYIEDISEITDRTSFIVLRPRDRKKAQAAAEYAKENLLGLPYSVSVGLTSKKFPDTPKLTNCSHLVWYAYKAQGVDIDNDGGPFVFPEDMLLSDELEVVQVYGINPQKVLK